ncbi:hypothetical protein BKA70DRAFT_1199383 [Coprinopsis sp. MPI-PUGE-AT-0042]|nr:hypothetical protein BKA70DRAFT_1199383 [Coprinopsis sp. MPI-PUGE-AT-0042]
MLLGRALSSRVAGSIRRYALAPHRPLHTTRPRLQYAFRPPGLVAKLWMRADGTPRSKLKGAIYTALATTSGLTLLSFADIVGEYDQVNYVLTSLVYIQFTDSAYSSVDFSDERSARNYFYDLCTSIPDQPESVFELIFNAIDEVQRNGGPAAVELHETLRKAADDVHAALRKIQTTDALQVGLEALKALDDTFARLYDLMTTYYGLEGENAFVKHSFVRDDKPTPRGSDYGTIG